MGQLYVRGLLLLLVIPSVVFARKETLTQPELMPTSCETLMGFLSRGGSPVTPTQVNEVLELANKPSSMIDARLAAMPAIELSKLIEKSLDARWALVGMDAADLDPNVLPGQSALKRENPGLASGRPLSSHLLFGFQKQLSEANAFALAKRAAIEFEKKSSVAQKRQFFSDAMDDLERQGRSWYHQTRVDQVIELAIGLKSEAITKDIQKRKGPSESSEEELYEMASASLLLTPYHDMQEIFSIPALQLAPGQKVVDLGAGMGRVGVFLGLEHPGVKFTGYEIMGDRIKEGQRIGEALQLGENHKFLQQDLSDPNFKPEPADIYYAFNPVTGKTFDKILEDLRQVGEKNGKPFKIVVYGPSPFEKLNAQPWLKKLSGHGIPKSDEFGIYQFDPAQAKGAQTLRVAARANIQGKKSPVPEYPESRELQDSDSHLFKSDRYQPSFSFLAPNYMMSWNTLDPYHVSKMGDATLLQFTTGAETGWLLEPAGVSHDRKIDVMENVFRQGKSPGFMYVSEPVAVELVDRMKAFPLVAEKDEYVSDYVYRMEDLRDLKATKKLRDRGNQIKNFDKKHPKITTSAEGFTPAQLKDLALVFLKNWTLRAQTRMDDATDPAVKWDYKKAVKEGNTVMEVEKRMGTDAIRFFIFEEGRIVGYLMAEVRPMPVVAGSRETAPTAIVYVQKTDGGTPNAVVKLNHEFVKYLNNNPDKFGEVTHVNLMDDGGVQGLRRIKKDYSPLENVGSSFRIMGSGQ